MGKQQGHSQSHKGARSIGADGVAKEVSWRRSWLVRRVAGFPEGESHTCENWQGETCGLVGLLELSCMSLWGVKRWCGGGVGGQDVYFKIGAV